MTPSSNTRRPPNPPSKQAAIQAASRPPLAELRALGKSLRDTCPRESHAEWTPSASRPDPLKLLKTSNKGRLPELVPLRFGRMVRTPFTFYRGTALNMAADLAETPVTGLRVQACGDCHLMNFGGFATPERRVIFDINDMDETLPAPWEWDIKRLVASFVLACRNNDFDAGVARNAVLACTSSYRERMAEYSRMPVLDVWYSSVDADKALQTVKDEEARKRIVKRIETARQRNTLEHDFPKLAAIAGRVPSIRDNPPLIFHPRDQSEASLLARAREGFAAYRGSMQEDRRALLDRYEIKDVAIKVVGVGSVGTLCAVMLMMASEKDPLFLQVKEARASVLEPFAGRSLHPNHGQRVVNGYRMIQSASDIFLGWTENRHGRHFYVRQLRDMKLSPMVEIFTPRLMWDYAMLCGWTLARAHARSGEPAAISGYLGKSDIFDKAMVKFANAYADQSEQDHAVLKRAVQAGQVEAVIEPE